ncbi:hypothetical protein MT418_004749 [Batrachochytrium dendrobatidis]
MESADIGLQNCDFTRTFSSQSSAPAAPNTLQDLDSQPIWPTLKNPILTYAEDTSIWSSLASEFNARLPLRHLSWQNPLRSSRNSSSTTHIIPSLNLDVKPYSLDLFPKLAPGGLHQNSLFVHIFLVGCEDMEYYKNNVRSKIQEWLNIVMTKKGQEWMIVYISGGAVKSRSGIFNMVGSNSVFDKIRTDFSLKKTGSNHFHYKSLCIQLKLSNNDAKDSEFWSDLFDRIKESLMSAMIQQISQLEEDTRRFEQQRLMPGWNYCQYFILKESIAFTYELAKFYEEALLHYDELEATFHQTLNEQGAPWFHKFGGVETGDDYIDIFSLDRKPYRDLIIQNQITIFDFREYLFGRQCCLILLLESPADVCQRTKTFAVTFSKTLTDYKVSLPRNFKESWIYSLCMQTVRKCDAVFNVLTMPEAIAQVYESLRAELLQMSKFQLDRIGIRIKMCENPLFVDSLALTDSTQATSAETCFISNPELLLAISSIENFGNLYQHITNLAVQGFTASGRFRSALALQSDLAFWYFFRKNYEQASEIWEIMAFKHSERGWHFIEIVIIERLAKCYRELGRFDKLVECCLYLVAHSSLTDQQHANDYVDDLVSAAASMKDVLSHPGLELFKVLILSSSSELDDDGAVSVEISIDSVLSKEFHFSLISLTLVAGDGKEMTCIGQDIMLQSGKNIVHVVCKKSAIPGVYSPSVMSMESGKLHFHHDLSHKDRQKSIRINETSQSLTMNATLPRKIVQGEPETILSFEIRTGANILNDARLTISALSNIGLTIDGAVVYHIVSFPDAAEREVSMGIEDGKLCLPDVKEYEQITFQLPFKLIQDSRSVEHKLKMLLSCTSFSQRKLFSSVVRVALVHDFIINESLLFESYDTIVQFGLKCKDGSPLRIVSFDTTCADGAAFESLCLFHEQTVFPGALVNLLYRLSPQKEAVMASNDTNRTLELKIGFIPLLEELESFVMARIKHILQKQDLSKYTTFITEYARKHLISQISLVEYAAFQVVDFNPLDIIDFEAMIVGRDANLQAKLKSMIRILWDDVKLASMDRVRKESNPQPSFLTYISRHMTPHLVLQVSLIPTVLTTLEPNTMSRNRAAVKDTVIGDMLPCTFTVMPTTWNIPVNTVEAEYEIHVDFSIFSMSGKRRQRITIEKGKPSVYQVVLCPLHVGQVLLPDASVNVLSGPDSESIDQYTAVINISAGSQIAILPLRQSAKIFLELECGDASTLFPSPKSMR